MKEDWIECTLREVSKIGSSKRILKKEYVSEGIPFYRTKEIKELSLGKEISIELYISNEKYNDIKERFDIPKKGDVLISAVGTIGITYTIKNNEPFYFKDGNLIWLRDIQGLESTFLNLGLTHFVRNSSILKTSGSAYNALTIEKLNSLPFPLPPLIEQKAIIKKIEELFSSLDSGIADLKKAQNQLVIYRQAVLKKAFEGELTKEWRAKQTNLPSADELLELIKEERQKHYDQQLADWKEAVKVWEKNQELGKKPKKPKKIIEYSEMEQEGALPILNLGELVFQISNKMMPEEAPDFPFIGMDCLEKNALKPHFTYKFKEFKSAGNWFNKNHVLYGRLRPYLNKVYQAEYEGVASGEFIILETIKGLNPNYLKLILHQQDFVHWSNNQSAGDKPRVKFDQIALYPIKLPTIQEQHQIVQEIESRLSVCDKVEKDIADSLEKAQALRQSILKKAFEGKLLNEEEIAECKADAAYEPASVLLERIKVAKQIKKVSPKKKKTK